MSACKGCIDRYPGCHGSCDKDEYLAFKRRNEQAAQQRLKERDINAYQKDAVNYITSKRWK